MSGMVLCNILCYFAGACPQTLTVRRQVRFFVAFQQILQQKRDIPTEQIVRKGRRRRLFGRLLWLLVRLAFLAIRIRQVQQKRIRMDQRAVG